MKRTQFRGILHRILTGNKFVIVKEEKRERQENLLILPDSWEALDSEYGELI